MPTLDADIATLPKNIAIKEPTEFVEIMLKFCGDNRDSFQSDNRNLERLRPNQFAPDQHAPYLVRPGTDVEQLGVAHEAFDGPVLGVTSAS
jgi:hypothetical protein